VHSEVRVEVDGRTGLSEIHHRPGYYGTPEHRLSIVFRRVRVGVGLIQSFILMFDRE
jgi:hypothetical protein